VEELAVADFHLDPRQLGFDGRRAFSLRCDESSRESFVVSVGVDRLVAGVRFRPGPGIPAGTRRVDTVARVVPRFYFRGLDDALRPVLLQLRGGW
jgi:hypothetical protein